MSIAIQGEHDAAAAVDAVSERFGGWCRRFTEKSLANLINCEVRTAKGFRSGSLPNNRHLIRMIELWGLDWLEFVFEPILRETDLDLERRLTRIEAGIATLRRDLADEKRVVSCRRADRGRSSRMVPETGASLARRWSASATIVLCLATMVASLLFPDPAEARPLRSFRYRPGVSRVTRGNRGEG